jgi:hypothetical protein
MMFDSHAEWSGWLPSLVREELMSKRLQVLEDLALFMPPEQVK